MVEIKDIDSDDKLYKWLKEQPENYSALIAHRRSMRILPKVWVDVIDDHYAVDSRYNLIFAILRANLISGLKENSRPSEDEKNFRNAASNAREILVFELDKYEKSFGSFINLSGAGYTADAITVSAYDNVLANAYYPYDGVSKLMDWRALQSDIFMLASSKMLGESPLWGDVMPPLFIEWDRVQTALKIDSVNWQFWIKWYEAALNGEPLNQEMLERIALIPSEDWEQGPVHVNGLIAAIEAEFNEVPPDVQTMPSEVLVRNQSIIEAQLDTLAQLVTQEMTRLRGRNDFTEAEGKVIAARVAVLEGILAAIDKIKTALEGETPSKALAVIDEQLPMVAKGAAELAHTEEQPQISVSVAQMGETISFLTQRGTPGMLATGIAAAEWTISQPMKWWKHFSNSKQ